jgi:hypothetical protein
MILSLPGKAVLTGQVAVMCDVEAKRLYDSRTVLEIKDRIAVNIPGKQLSFPLQIPDLLQRFLNLRLRIPSAQLPDDVLIGNGRILLQEGDRFIDQIIHYMNTAAVHIENDVISVASILVYQNTSKAP